MSSSPRSPRIVAQSTEASPLLSHRVILHASTKKDELGNIVHIALPSAVSLLCRFGMGLTDLAFVGHLGNDYLAAASLALVWMTVTQVVVSRSVNTSLTTLASQSYGCSNFELVAVWFQITLIVSTLMCIPVALSWYFLDDLLVLVRVDHEFASSAGHFAQYSIIGMWASSAYYNLSAYFRAQSIVLPFLYVNMLFVGINVGLNFVFIHGVGGWDGYGFVGSPIATSVTRWGQLIFLVVYMFVYKRLHRSTWRGWKPDEYTWSRLREFGRMSFANCIAAALEEYQLQLVAIFAMHLGKDDLATHNAMLELFFVCTSFMYGISTATNVRVGQCLGSGNIQWAKTVMYIACVWLSLPIGLSVGAFFILGRNIVGRIFSPDPHIQHLAASISWLLGPAYFMLCLFYTAMACLDAQGRPAIVALSFFIGAWLVCIPTGYALAFPAHMGLQGLWLGLIAGYGVITFIVSWAVYKSDWDQLGKDAVERSRRKSETQSENEPLAQPLASPA